MSAEPARRDGDDGDGETVAPAAKDPVPSAEERRSSPSGSPAPAPSSAGHGGHSGSGFFATVSPHRSHVEASPTGRRLAVLSMTALGVVYGDIGTSPLYSIKECFKAEYGLSPTATNIYGVLSLIVWSLILVVSVKYVAFILRADNKGEGGVFALLALVLQREHRAAYKRRRLALIALGLFGGAFLYGDGIITPAISVLGAVEGLEVAAPTLGRFVVPASFAIIAVLFYFQFKGTARVGGLFGWVMLLWFASIAALGIHEIARNPGILQALNPWHGVQFFIDHPWRSFVVLGAVVLVITGGEALYADMGHFGKRPIRIVWFGLVLPSLLLNYFGQGSLLLHHPTAVENPFYHLAPDSLRIPLLLVATAAAIVASQALISGAFSLTQQAVQLGYVPRVTIVHTSAREAGQIYIPEVNKALAVGTLLLVVAFRSSDALGAAYGLAVTGTMSITTLLFYVVMRQRWNWPRWRANLVLAFFLTIDLSFFLSNLLKLPHGGWVPLAIATVLYVMMSTWKLGRMMLNRILTSGALPLDLFLDDVGRRKPTRVPGTAVFMSSSPEGVPVVLLHHLKHNKVLHEQVILMSVLTEEVPETDPAERVVVEKLEHGFWRVIARYGFMQMPNVGDVLARSREFGIWAKPGDTTFYLGRERVIVAGGRRERERPGVRRAAPEPGTVPLRMARWRKKLFVVMSRNARSATEFLGIPPNRVVELGAQVEM